jgi:Protein of unknown function (DUF3037)
MPEPRPFAYTILRLVPRIDRGECVNVGVVVFCRQHRFLAARFELDEGRLRALSPDLGAADVAPTLEAIDAVLRGDPAAGPLGALDQSDRFGWVAARSSTVIQASEVHTGITEDPAATLERLFGRLVASP